MSGYLRLAVLVLAAGLAGSPSDALDENSKMYKEVGRISDTALRAIDAARPELLKVRPGWSDYTADVVETDHLFIVSCCRKQDERTINIVEGNAVAASIPQCPGSFSVELDKVSLKVLDEHFSRD